MVGPAGEVPEAIALISGSIHGEQVSDVRLVLLEGASHGTCEFFDLQKALTCKMISQRGVGAVASDWPDTLRVDPRRVNTG